MAGGVPSLDGASDTVEKQHGSGSEPSSWRDRGQPLPGDVGCIYIHTSGEKRINITALPG